MATTTASRKQKGRKLQQFVRDKVLEQYPSLTERDVKSTPMGCSGEDVMLSEAAVKLFPYSVEAKNVEKLNIWSALTQSESNNRELEPLLVFKRNHSKTYVALEFDYFMALLKRLDEVYTSEKR